MNFDVRNGESQDIEAIIFEDEEVNFTCVAHKIEKYNVQSVRITDEQDYVVIHSVTHADNLIKALEKAKQLGWIK